MSPTEEQVLNLGLVYRVSIEDGIVRVKMTTTSPACPVGDFLAQEVKRVVQTLDGVDTVGVEFVWDPPWTPEMMSEDAKKKLGW